MCDIMLARAVPLSFETNAASTLSGGEINAVRSDPATPIIRLQSHAVAKP